MAHSPLTLPADMMITDAEALMQKHRVFVLLVTDKEHNVAGLVRIFD